MDSQAKFLVQPPGFATKAIHSGQKPEMWTSRAVVPPISMSTTFKQFAPGQHAGFEYSRSGNPTRNVLESCLASLDNAKYALAFSSGLGVQTAIISTLKTGDGIITSDDCYGGTNRLFRSLAVNMGIDLQTVDLTDLNNLKKAFKANTKLVWMESPSNPLMKVLDIQAIANLVHKESKAFLVVDNTFLSAYFQRPLGLGADVVMYSLTKYMNGHSDVVMGSIATNNDDLYEQLKFNQNSTGIVPSPFDCYLVNRSLKTLSLRMTQHFKNSMAVANYLEAHVNVAKVMHPALPSHPQHEISLKQTYGHSGIMSFYIKDGDLNKSTKFLQSLKVFALAESLGGYESLAELPSVMTHASVPEDQRKILGITDSLIRLSVGLEDQDDLIKDLEQAFNAMN